MAVRCRLVQDLPLVIIQRCGGSSYASCPSLERIQEQLGRLTDVLSTCIWTVWIKWNEASPLVARLHPDACLQPTMSTSRYFRWLFLN